MSIFTETTIEQIVLEYLALLGWQVIFVPEIAPSESALRDALLPSLMSGEVTVENVDRG